MKRTLLILALLPAFILAGCSSLAQLITAEGIYANKTYVIEAHGTNIGIGFEQLVSGNLPLPKIGYWKTDVVATAVAAGDGEGVRYVNERDVSIATTGETEIRSGNKTEVSVDAQQYLKE